jgi:hypothetical protein
MRCAECWFKTLPSSGPKQHQCRRGSTAVDRLVDVGPLIVRASPVAPQREHCRAQELRIWIGQFPLLITCRIRRAVMAYNRLIGDVQPVAVIDDPRPDLDIVVIVTEERIKPVDLN